MYSASKKFPWFGRESTWRRRSAVCGPLHRYLEDAAAHHEAQNAGARASWRHLLLKFRTAYSRDDPHLTFGLMRRSMCRVRVISTGRSNLGICRSQSDTRLSGVSRISGYRSFSSDSTELNSVFRPKSGNAFSTHLIFRLMFLRFSRFWTTRRCIPRVMTTSMLPRTAHSNRLNTFSWMATICRGAGRESSVSRL